MDNKGLLLFDTHAHLCDTRYDDDREALLSSFSGKGVKSVIDVACETGDFEKTLLLSEKYDFIHSAMGLHPQEAGTYTKQDLEALEKKIRAEKGKRIVAIGEMGLDYHFEEYDDKHKKRQRELFDIQLCMAEEYKLPCILHVRDAYRDALDILKAHKNTLVANSGIMHCYSGSTETAFECMDMGLYIAFGGSVTFSNAKKIAKVAESVPTDRLLIETDCPYMAPVPHRGERNDPTLICFVLEKLSELHGISEPELSKITFDNANQLFFG